MKGWAAAVAFVVALAPRVALACPVCFSTENEANRLAYLFTAIFLTLLPFAVVGGILFWVVRRVRALEAPPAVEAAAVDEPVQG